MRISRRSLKSSVTQLGKAPVSDPDPAFVDRLESQLMNDGATAPLPVDNVVPFRARARRAVVIGVAAATLTGAAAAAALVVGTGDDNHRLITATEPAAPGAATTTSTESTSTTSSLPTTMTSSVAASASTTVAGTTPTTQGNTPAPPTTDTVPKKLPTCDASRPDIVPPACVLIDSLNPDSTPTVPPSESTSTTEVHVPATLGISCVPDVSHVTCTWTAGPAGTDHYLVLRSRPGGVDGRVFTPVAGQLTYADTQIISGDSFYYLIHAMDAANHSLGHSAAYYVLVP